MVRRYQRCLQPPFRFRHRYGDAATVSYFGDLPLRAAYIREANLAPGPNMKSLQEGRHPMLAKRMFDIMKTIRYRLMQVRLAVTA